MGYAELEKSIREEYAQRIRLVNESAKKKEDAILEAIREDARAESERILSDYGRRANLISRQIIGKANMEAMRLLDDEKARILDDTFQKLLERLNTLSDGQKSKLMAHLASDEAIIEGDKTVRVRAQDAQFLPPNLKSTVKTEDIGEFGLIISSADGLISVDNRISQAASRIWDELLPDVTGIMFDDG
jgi:vacuolar-type H+-ATPase subunit E/Vma4